jgi:type IV pilus assembly protein PilB
MRLTAKMNLTREKKQLGFSDEELKRFDNIFANPNGIILVTGPTGSGKSTTLYTALSELNTDDVNIITVEDPVEANIDGINQVQVNPKADLTFASALRSILRQDPDIIMIGEIRDKETASIAVTASITGHLVVSTLHTNSAAASLTRLENMGIESYLLADSTVGVIAQRLARRLCTCKKKKKADAREKKLLGIPVDQDIEIYEPGRCNVCNETGYLGRIGVYEIMPISNKIRTIITNHGSTDDIEKTAIEEGMSTLKMSCAKLVKEGITSISEMRRIVYSNEDEEE